MIMSKQLNKKDHEKIVNTIAFYKYPYNDGQDQYKNHIKSMEMAENYLIIPDVHSNIQSNCLPSSEIAGGLNWSMSYQQIETEIRTKFIELKNNDNLISISDFNERFKKDGHKNFNPIFKDSNGKRWIKLNENNLTRVFGSEYVKSKIDPTIRFDAPKQLIVLNDINNIIVNVSINFRNFNCYSKIYSMPYLFPILKEIENGFILSEYIEDTRPVATKLKNNPFLNKIGFIDFKNDNILHKRSDDTLWITDCEMFSFLSCRPELSYEEKKEFLDGIGLNYNKYNFKLASRKYTLYAMMKFLLVNNNYISNMKEPINKEIDEKLDVLLNKYINFNINLNK